MRTLIVGRGEIGSALLSVLSDYLPDSYDVADGTDSGLKPYYEIVHICFGHFDGFLDAVRNYQNKYQPKYTVVHSTVPVGTCRKISAIHSPVIGQHPNLVDGLKTFSKMIGGKQASQVADYFRRVGLRVMLFDSQEATEAAKLFLTESYRVNIEFAQRVKQYCDQNELNFHEVYTLPAHNYNDGYEQLGQHQYVRPVLQPIEGTIGGHCVLPNKELLK